MQANLLWISKPLEVEIIEANRAWLALELNNCRKCHFASFGSMFTEARGILSKMGNAKRGAFYQADDLLSVLEEASSVSGIRRMAIRG